MAMRTAVTHTRPTDTNTRHVRSPRLASRYGLINKLLEVFGDNSSASNAAAGQRNIRHNGVNDAWVDAARAGLGTAVSPIEKGYHSDLAQRAAAAANNVDLNVGHIPDWAARGTAKNGRHLVGETKCYESIVSYSEAPRARARAAASL